MQLATAAGSFVVPLLKRGTRRALAEIGGPKAEAVLSAYTGALFLARRGDIEPAMPILFGNLARCPMVIRHSPAWLTP